jgi:hypothetical protein
MQRQEEMEMQEEAVKRNMELSEDRAKKLLWAVMGQKGEKRLVRRFAERGREDESNEEARPGDTHGEQRRSDPPQRQRSGQQCGWRKGSSDWCEVCFVSDMEPDVILITESWCNSSIMDAFLSITGYEVQPNFRIDRADTRLAGGGGYRLLVSVKEGLRSSKN